MRHIYPIYSILLIAFLATACVNDPELGGGIRNARKPEVKTNEITAKTANSITLSGEVVQENGAPVTEAGFCWSTSATFSFDDKNKKAIAERKVKFETTIDNLKNNTKYHICAYAINQVDTAYGEIYSITTSTGLGFVKTLKPTNLRASSVQCGGLITLQGEAQVEERGIFLMTRPEPSATDSFIPIDMKADSFYCTIQKLKPETQYYVRALVRNRFGYYDGSNVESFRTTDGKPILDSFKRVGEVDFTSADFTMRVASEGDAPVTACGFCFSTDMYPTIEDGDTIICGKGTGEFIGHITKMQQQKTYYVRAYATNSMGTRYSDGVGMETILKSDLPVVNTSEVFNIKEGTAMARGEVKAEGASPVSEVGICWNTSPNPVIDKDGALSMSIKSPESSLFTLTLTKLKGGITYYARAYARNEKGIQYGDQISFVTPSTFTPMDQKFSGGFRIQGSVAYCTITNDIACMVGGDAGPNYTDDFWVYYSTSNTWRALGRLPKKFAWQSAFCTGVNVWLFGGRDESGKACNEVYYYDNTNIWQAQEKGKGWPDGMFNSSVCTIGSYAYFMGGCRDTLTNDVWVYSVGGNSWTQKKPFPIKQRGGIAVVIGEKIYAGLGVNNMTGPSAIYGLKLWSTDPNANSWEEETTFPGSGCLSGVVYDNRIFVVDTSGYIWIYDPATRNWSKKSQLPAAYRTVHCMYVLSDKKIYIGLGNSSDTLIKYDPSWDN